MCNIFLKSAFAASISLLVISSNSIAQSGYGSAKSGTQKPKAKASTTPKKGAATAKKGAASGYGAGAASTQNSGYGNAPATTDNSGGGYGSTPAASSGVASSVRPSNLPIIFKPNTGGGIGDSVKQSFRVDNAIDKQLIKERRPLEYERIREDDAVYSQRIWMEIDAREKMNQSFGYSADLDNGNQRFISILYNAIQSDSVIAFSAAEDDRFTTPLTKKQVRDVMFGGNDTTEVLDLKGVPISLSVSPHQINPDSIYRFRLKEDIVFDKKNSRMFKRILGIAPVMDRISSDGRDLGASILFWIYYPDLRPTLSKYEVYNPKNHNSRMTWEDLFEYHMFSYYILKSTLNNPKDRAFDKYINDPLFRLLEGEKVKEKIFNYESDLWSL